MEHQHKYKSSYRRSFRGNLVMHRFSISVTDHKIYRENEKKTTDLIHWDHFEKLVALL